MRIENSVEQLKVWLNGTSNVKGKVIFGAQGNLEFVPLTTSTFRQEERRGPGIGFHVHPLRCPKGSPCSSHLPSPSDITSVLAEAATKGEFVLAPYGIYFLSAEDVVLDEDRAACTGPLCMAVTKAYTTLRSVRKPEHAYRTLMNIVPNLSDEVEQHGLRLSFWPINFEGASHVELPGFKIPEFKSPPFKLPVNAPIPLVCGLVVGLLMLLLTWFVSKKSRGSIIPLP